MELGRPPALGLPSSARGTPNNPRPTTEETRSLCSNYLPRHRESLLSYLLSGHSAQADRFLTLKPGFDHVPLLSKASCVSPRALSAMFHHPGQVFEAPPSGSALPVQPQPSPCPPPQTLQTVPLPCHAPSSGHFPYGREYAFQQGLQKRVDFFKNKVKF